MTPINPPFRHLLLMGIVTFASQVSATRVAGADTLLISDKLDVSHVELVELTDTVIVHLDDDKGWRSVELDSCIGFIETGARVQETGKRGALHLVDGQIIPGGILSNADPQTDVVVWNHPWLSRIEVPLDQIAAVTFAADATMPVAGDADVVVLANGDRYQGFIVEIGNPVALDVDDADGQISRLTIPLDRIASIGLVSQRRTSGNRRVWFTDGSVLDVHSLRIGDDGLARLQSIWTPDNAETEMPASRIAGALFMPGRLTSLASLRVDEVAGPEIRYVIPRPVASTEPTPLDLADLVMHGPLTATWHLPRGAQRFAATAQLPPHARVWGDYELVVRVDDEERTRVHLNSASPTAEINITLDRGSELSIELTEGARGSIQDELLLQRAMLLVE